MYVVDITYVASLELVNKHLPAHVTYLKEQYAAGVFLASGRKEPRTGGVIIARCGSPEELKVILDQDPFVEHGVTRYEVTQFIPSMAGKGYEGLLE